jgi:hypothetical protein
MQRVEDRNHVVCQPLCAVTRFRVAGSTVSSAGYTVDVQKFASFTAKSSKTWTEFPEPANRTSARPDPPQSSTSRWTPSSTCTNWIRCGDGSFHLGCCAHRDMATHAVTVACLRMWCRTDLHCAPFSRRPGSGGGCSGWLLDYAPLGQAFGSRMLADLAGLIRVAGTFSVRRSDICGAGSVPCPRFPPAATARETPDG